MFQPSTSRDPLLTREGDSDFNGGEGVEKHAYNDKTNVGGSVYFTDIGEYQSLTPIEESTVVDGVDANVLKLRGEDQRFSFVEFSPDWSLVVTLTSGGTFSVWDATNEWVLVGSKRLHHERRTLKCIAFDPYNEKAVLLCFDTGEIFLAYLRGPSRVDASGTCQDRGIFRLRLVHKCEGNEQSGFDFFKFSSDNKIMVYYNFDGILAAVQFESRGVLKAKTLSNDFVLKKKASIYISKRNILITSIMKSSEDKEPSGRELKTLFWSKLNFEGTENENKLVRLDGRGYLSDDGKYVLISKLDVAHQCTRCQIKMYLVEDDTSTMDINQRLVAARSLEFAENHPHLECLDWNMLDFFHVEHTKTEPLIAIYQTNYAKRRLLFWDTNSDTIIYEIDLTLNKEIRKSSKIKYCFSSNFRWLGVCFIGANMIGLICVRSGVFVWVSHVPQINKEDVDFCTLKFDQKRIRLMISLKKVVYIIQPSCMSEKAQRHPTHDDLYLNKTVKTYHDFEIQELARWPKHILFNVLLTGHIIEKPVRDFLIDAVISLKSRSMAMICQKHDNHCFVFIVDCSRTVSVESLWFLVTGRWNQCFLNDNTSPLVKKIKKEHSHEGMVVFFYNNDETGNEHLVLLSSREGIEMMDLDSNLTELSEWTLLSEKSCFSLTQSKDCRRVISLGDDNVLIIDLNEKRIVKNVKYSFDLSRWWRIFVESVNFFEVSNWYSFVERECKKERELSLRERLQRLLDVSDNGEKILIGWDNKQNRSLILTSDKTESQFRIEWEQARESLHQCSMLTENDKWLGFIDYEKLKRGDVVLCVTNTSNNCQQRIWLGLDKSHVEPLQSRGAHFFLQIDKIEENLTILVLQNAGTSVNLKQVCVTLSNKSEHVHDQESFLNTLIKPIAQNAYGTGNQLYTLNMRVANITNFQRVLIEEGEDTIEEITRCAIDSRVKISDLYLSHNTKKQEYTTLLEHALEQNKTSMVKLCLGFIKNGLFPFHSAATQVTDSFSKLLSTYNELLVPILRENLLSLNVAEVFMPAQVFHSQQVIYDVVFTFDTMLEPDKHFILMASEDTKTSKGKMHRNLNKSPIEVMNVQCYVSLYYVADACKVGLKGIVRKLLMHEVDPSIFNTSLIRATITWKWEKVWKKQCLRELYCYFLLLIFFTCYAIGIGIFGDEVRHNKWIGLYLFFPLVIAFVFAIVFVFDEYMQLTTYIKDGKQEFSSSMWGLKHYFWNSKWNLVDLSSYFLLLILIPIFHALYTFGKCSKAFLFVIVAIESLLAWFKLWYYSQPFERASAFVLLIQNVIYDCLPFLSMALAIMIGFSVALFVLFNCRTSLPSTNGTEEGDLIHESFGNIGLSLSTLFYAMVGTFDPKIYYNNHHLSHLTTFVFVLYMALEMIVVLNMLIAIMGDTFDKIKNEEESQIIFRRAVFIDACEASLSAQEIREVEKKTGKYLFVLTPKDTTNNAEYKSWKGKINVIIKKVETTIKMNNERIEKNMNKQLEEHQKLMNKQLEEHQKLMNKQLEEHQKLMHKQLEEHQSKIQDFLLSNLERIKDVKREASLPTLSSSN